MKAKMTTFGAALMTLMTAGALLLSPPSLAQSEEAVPLASDQESAFLQRSARPRVADLAGTWAISLGGNTGCGLSTLYVTVTLDATGSGLARIIGSSTGCPPGDDPAEPFQILSLNADGSGTAGLSCGPGCGWTFTVQVPRGNPNLFTLVDVQDRNNVLVGTAARKW